MDSPNDEIERLQSKMDTLVYRYEEFAREISALRSEVHRLKTEKEATNSSSSNSVLATNLEHEKQIAPPVPQTTVTTAPTRKDVQYEALPPKPKPQSRQAKSDIEKFIGENLINKIGIAITVLGVAIGAKYSIENDLISPLTRIILGYLFGFALLGVGIKLKKDYENYSAVLVSGAMAIMYFITYTAYGLYELIPQALAFALMVVFTVFTIVAALQYNLQLIAHIGMVGAYAVPFLLSDDSGRVAVLFSYVALINVGILVISLFKYWKPIYYSSFTLTWLIYISWFILSYEQNEHLQLALLFLVVFYATFYVILLAYKLFKDEPFKIDDIILLLANSFIFYGIGYAICSRHPIGEEVLGLYTLGNALIHFAVSLLVYRRQSGDRNLFYMLVGLVLVFISIAIPVQLDGNWVTLLWAGQAALLFWIGRSKQVEFYERLSYPLMIVAFISINQDWDSAYHQLNGDNFLTPLLNMHFLSSMLFVGAFGLINFINMREALPDNTGPQKPLQRLMWIFIPAILLFSLYNSFRLELVYYWDQLFVASEIKIDIANEEYPQYYNDYDLQRFRNIWTVNYSLLFCAVIAIFNITKLKNNLLGILNLLFCYAGVLFFLVSSLMELGSLRESYLNQELSQYYERGIFNIAFRYVSYIFVMMAILAARGYVKSLFADRQFKIAFDYLLHISLLWILSSEVVNWMELVSSTHSYKLGLTILWGVYALSLIILGINTGKKYLRISAIVLFGITLLKLFVYDISHINTIAKTVVFVLLGILLLIISFLYNKYRQNISDETKA